MFNKFSHYLFLFRVATVAIALGLLSFNLSTNCFSSVVADTLRLVLADNLGLTSAPTLGLDEALAFLRLCSGITYSFT